MGLAIIGALFQRAGTGGFVGWGASSGFQGEPGWAWWFVAAAACFIIGTTLHTVSYRHAGLTPRKERHREH